MDAISSKPLPLQYIVHLSLLLFVCVSFTRIVSATGNTQPCLLNKVGKSVKNFVWSPDGNYIALTDGRTLEIWGTEATEPEYGLPKNKRFEGIVDFDWSPNSDQVVLAQPDKVSVHNLQTGDVTNVWNLSDSTDSVTSIDWSPDESLIAIRTLSDVIIWNPIKNEVIKQFTGYGSSEGAFIGRVSWSSNGEELAFSYLYTLFVWNSTSEKIVSLHDNGGVWVTYFAWNNNTQIAVGDLNGIDIIDTITGEEITAVNGAEYPYFWTQDSKYFMTIEGDTSYENYYLIRRNTKSWKLEAKILIADYALFNPISIQPNGSIIAVLSKFGTVNLLRENC